MKYKKSAIKSFFVSFLTLVMVISVFPNLPILIDVVKAETLEERESRLNAELKAVEKEQKATELILANTKNQSASLTRDITILDAQIKSAQLNIKKKNIQIEQLGRDISIKDKNIVSLEAKIDQSMSALEQIYRKSYQAQSYSTPELVLQSDSLAEFFTSIDNYETVNSAMLDLIADIKDNKTEVKGQRDTLDKKKNSEMDARKVIEQEKATIEAKNKEKNYLLSVTKGQEKSYEGVLAEKKKKAAEIRAALFALRDSDAIPFDKAYQYAVEAYSKTNVRPAFLLAILTQESSLGKNVGTCYVTDFTTGDGASAKSGNLVKGVMKPGRDIAPFLTITKELGRDPKKTLVSCPFTVGYGGAMGPAQFIPSTWMIIRNKVASNLGSALADPWTPRDAFMASAIFLSDLGAVNGSYTGERNAACRYYSGRACSGPVNTPYGDQVMYKANSIQTNMINPIMGI